MSKMKYDSMIGKMVRVLEWNRLKNTWTGKAHWHDNRGFGSVWYSRTPDYVCS